MPTWLVIEEKSQQLANDCAKIEPKRLTLKSSVSNGAVEITRAFRNNNFVWKLLVCEHQLVSLGTKRRSKTAVIFQDAMLILFKKLKEESDINFFPRI